MSLLGKKLLELTSKSSKRKRQIVMPNYADASHMGIIYTYGDEKKEESINELIKLIDDEKQVDVLCYINSKEIVTTKHPSFQIDQLNNWGKFNSKEVEYFQNANFDFLIHFDFEEDEIVQSLLRQTKAKCRVGFHSENTIQYYELMISMNKSAGSANFAKQIMKYIKAIK